jgi:undecaprenyl diphosphate synthase
VSAALAPVPGGGPSGRGLHVAIIMDGNGRWATKRMLPRVAGHRAGIEAVRRVVRAAPDLGVDVLTLYAFSSENWRRPAEEVRDLMGLLRTYIRSEIDELDANGVRLSFIGDTTALSQDIQTLLADAAARTRTNTRMRLVIALNYGSWDEMARAVRALAADAAAGRVAPESITTEMIEARLDTADLPPVDVLVRTSGEMRLSNFLLWQAAYAELVFTERLWPDFDGPALAEAVAQFRSRERRFGGR